MSRASRRIFKRSSTAQEEVRDLLQSIFVAESICPSITLWLVSPWVSDIAVIDNRGGGFESIEPSWASRWIRLSEVLGLALGRGTQVVVACRPDDHNRRFRDLITDQAEAHGAAERLLMHQDEETSLLHQKGLLGDRYYLRGSMNFTQNGITLLEEAVELETDPRILAEARLSFSQRWGGRL